MAKPDAKAAAPEAPPPKKSRKLLIIILALVLVLVAGGGAAAFFLMKGSHADDEDATQEEDAKPVKKKKKDEKHAAPVYVALETFTVNLMQETGDQYLQVAMSLEVEEAPDADKVKSFMPKLKSQIMLLLSSKKASELGSKEGKEKLSNELRDTINEVLEPPVKGRKAEGPVKEVLFTSFIIQ